MILLCRYMYLDYYNFIYEKIFKGKIYIFKYMYKEIDFSIYEFLYLVWYFVFRLSVNWIGWSLIMIF